MRTPHWRRYLVWRKNVWFSRVMCALHVFPWYDPVYEAYIKQQRAEIREFLDSLDKLPDDTLSPADASSPR